MLIRSALQGLSRGLLGALCLVGTLMATIAPLTRSRAAKTVPHPPEPITRSTSKRAAMARMNARWSSSGSMLSGRRGMQNRTPPSGRLAIPCRTEHIPRMSRPIRVLVAKPGLDGHDRGAKVVAAALRDAGMEVIYTGLHQTPEMIATAAIQEDVDVVGLSILSGAHMTLFPRVLDLLKKEGRDDILLTGGGIIPKEDMDALRALGVGTLFGPGTSTGELIAYIRAWFARERQEA